MSNISEFLDLAHMSDSLDDGLCSIGVDLDELKFEIETLISECERSKEKAAKWDDPQTQADLELAQALKWAIEKEIKFVRNTVNFRTSFVDAYDKSKLLSLFREQKRGAE